mgnify:CR=1 FL=1
MNDYVEGLYVKDGRLINSRPNGISGIEQAAAKATLTGSFFFGKSVEKCKKNMISVGLVSI